MRAPLWMAVIFLEVAGDRDISPSLNNVCIAKMLRLYRGNSVAAERHANRRLGDIGECHDLLSELFRVAWLVVIQRGRMLANRAGGRIVVANPVAA